MSADKYHLLEFTVMPNHVHVLFVPISADAGSVGHGSIGYVADAASVRIETRPVENGDVDYQGLVHCREPSTRGGARRLSPPHSAPG